MNRSAMNESGLKESIEAHKLQLAQLNDLISQSDELDRLELYDVQKDLEELIQVSEESLLSLQKGNLLASLSTDQSDHRVTTVSQSETSSRTRDFETETCGESSRSENVSEWSRIDDFIGTKCRTKYIREWGSFQHHNAMVIGVENLEEDNVELRNCEDSQTKKILVRVIFLNPICLRMLTCPYYLDGKCRFKDDTCRYSHGHLVEADELVEFIEPDHSLLVLGRTCLAKYEEDNLWYRAKIIDLCEDSVTVHYETYNMDAILDFHSVLPMEDHAMSDSSDDDVVLSDNDDSTVSTMTIPSKVGFAEWEAHTKGFGSRIMRKMGYIHGKGLGTNQEGRIDPVDITLLPAGKSLDYIAAMREKGTLKNPFKKKNKKKVEVDSTVTTDPLKATGSTTAAFDLINRLTQKGKLNAANPAPSESTNHEAAKRLGSADHSYRELKKDLSVRRSGDVRKKSTAQSREERAVNTQLMKSMEKITAAEKQLTKLNEQLSRNISNAHFSRTIEHNISTTKIEIDRLQTEERMIQQKIKNKNNSKKLTVF